MPMTKSSMEPFVGGHGAVIFAEVSNNANIRVKELSTSGRVEAFSRDEDLQLLRNLLETDVN